MSIDASLISPCPLAARSSAASSSCTSRQPDLEPRAVHLATEAAPAPAAPRSGQPGVLAASGQTACGPPAGRTTCPRELRSESTSSSSVADGSERGSGDRGGTRAEPLQVAPIGRKRQAVGRVGDVLAQMPHQGDLTLPLFEEDGGGCPGRASARQHRHTPVRITITKARRREGTMAILVARM